MSYKYRIIANLDHYEVQFRPWWSPFWFGCYGVNCCATIERARELVEQHKKYHSPFFRVE